LFSRAIDQSPESDDLAIRLPSLIDNITRLIFTNISRGLFEKDKIIFSFLITTSIMKQLDKIDQGVWNIFLRGPTVMTPEEKASMLDSPDLAVIPSLYWENLVSAELRSKGQFDGITKHVIDNWKEWREWTRSEFPYTEKMPGDYSEKLSNFDKFIMVKCLRVEMIQRSIS
jgi:dynein heavy chain